MTKRPGNAPSRKREDGGRQKPKIDTRSVDPLPHIRCLPWGWRCMACGSTCLRVLGSVSVACSWIAAHRCCDGSAQIRPSGELAGSR
jgi:hypothetical protein